MKKNIVALLAVCMFMPQLASGWGQVGHDATAYIAELNLKPSAKKKIEKYLGNHSIVYYSTWMDIYKADPRYPILRTCHTAYADPQTKQYVWSDRKPDADAITMVEECWERLKDYKNLDDSTIVVNLYALIHILGDIHCPGHVYYENMGKILNKYDVTFMGKPMTYHKVWDTPLLETMHPKWYYTEWGHQLNKLSKKEIKEMVAGTPRQWFAENATECAVIYDWGHPGADLKRDFVNAMQPIAEKQLQRGGYRLARILNDIFG